jgi:hypothetical protein
LFEVLVLASAVMLELLPQAKHARLQNRTTRRPYVDGSGMRELVCCNPDFHDADVEVFGGYVIYDMQAFECKLQILPGRGWPHQRGREGARSIVA